MTARGLDDEDRAGTERRGRERHRATVSGTPDSLNAVIRHELEYVDRLVALPFRAIRRTIRDHESPWWASVEEAVWAMEGMARLPVKFVQAAFGEQAVPDRPADSSAGRS